ncbi:hypothetical protein AB205_0203350 [Aquarana catesbeiana]|uniref:Dystonin n=1 Tax=Aquarana catesbeiana TaxID=8400 RepID=A0A2G9S9B4_AQUCT|nr:hypothetical protein AB205_0203350 [Aquarana catesbeiana]
MNSTCYGYYSSDSVLTGSNRTSISSNENVLSVHCGPKMISSYISFGSEQSSNSRLDMLQQIANRVQRDSLGCEDKLILARSALQVDTKRMESGIQFQNDSEIAGYLIECENLLRQQLVDVQTLVDGQYYQADQLVQRVASLRDELLALRNEYSSLYSKGRMLSSDQTQLMISGISQSLNSGFSQSLNPAMNSSVSHNMAPMSPTNLTPGISTNFAQGMAANLNQGVSGSLSPALQPVHTPGLPSSLNASYSQGFNSQLTPAMTPGFAPGFNQGLIQNYATGMNTNPLQSLKLMQVKKPLLKSSFADQNLPEEEVNLKFVQDLCSWVEEMQIQLDRGNWGSELSSIEFHLENHKHFHGGIEEFETSLKEAKMTELQISGPLKSSYSDTLHKVEGLYSKLLSSSRNRHKHLDALHSFVARATRELIWLNEKEEEEVAYDWSDRNQNISAKKDYHADLMRELDHKEEVIKSLQDTAEQMLLQNHPARSTIEAYKAAMQTQWNWILQLCSCVEQHIRQNTAYFEITIYKDDECVLGSNSHRGKWKVISPTGNEAMVPSVCFTVPAPNKEAIDAANRIEQMYQSVLSLWHESHINMKSMVSWHYLMSEIEAMRASKVSSIKTLLPGEHQQVMGNLKTRFEEFLEDSQESKMFSVSDISQLEREVNVCKLYYEELLKSAEREEQEESIYNLYTSEIRNFRLRLESIEERLIRQIRTPLDRDDLHESALRISEQEKVKKELDHLKVDLSAISEKCEEFFSQAAASPSIGALQGELNAVIQYMNTLYSMSSIYLEKLKTINLVLKNTQGAETLVKTYETKLCEEDVITADKVAIDRLVATLKQWRSEVDEKREVFHALEDGLQKAKAISDQMFKVHKERDLDFDWHKEKADQIAERWQNVHSQIENRLRDLDGISKSLKYYKESYLTLDSWIRQIEETQSKLQDSMSDSKALSKQLDQQKMLISEIEMKQSKVDECQKYSEQYSLAIKDYELQLMTYRALVDSHQKSPMKRRRFQSSSDVVVQEYMDLKTRYNALMTLINQFIKFSGETLKRLEEEEIVKSKQYDLTVEVTTVKQEKEFLINNEDQVFEERNILEGFRRSDLPKMGYMSSSYKSYAGSETSLSDSSSTDDRFIFQGLRKNVSAKQLVEARILDGKTMEQLESGRMTIQEVQKALDTYLTKATAIAGLYLEASREKISFSLAAKKGIIDKGLAFEFLEAQAVTGFIIDPSTGKKYSVEEAITSGFADQEFKEKLLEAEKAVIGYIHSGKRLSVFQAIEARLLERQKGKRILEAQITTGGVIDPIRSVRIPAEVAVLKGLLNHTTLKFLHEPASNVKGFHFPTNKQSMYYSELLQLCVLDLNSQTFLLPIGERNISAFSAEKGHKICIVDTRSSIELTRFEAYERGLIDQRSYLELSQYECQWETATVFDSQGKSQTHLIDRKTGRQFSLEEAVSQGKIDRSQIGKIKDGQISATELADIIVSRTRPAKDPNSPLAGFWILETSERVSAFKALKRNMVDRVTVFRCLEAQASTGGILDPSNGKKHSVSEALQKGLIDEVCAKQIQQFELAYTGVIQHSTKALLSAFEATNVNLLNKEIGSRSLEYQYLTGGLIDPKTHARLSLEDAIRKGIVDAATATKLKDEKSYVKNLTCPKSRRKISYKDALETAVFDCHTGFRLMKAPLPVNVGIPSLYFSSQ